MKKILTSKQMKECDLSTISSGVPGSVLMKRAADGVVDTVVRYGYDISKVLVVCGSGNNGGDGMLCARKFYGMGYDCHIWYVGKGHTMSADTEKIFEELTDLGMEFVEYPDMDSYTLILDAVLGTGVAFRVSGMIEDAVLMMNGSNTPVVSVDIPSGICSDTGNRLGCAVIADMTVAIQEYKRGHCLSDGINASGKLCCIDIGIDTEEVTDYDGIVPLSADEGVLLNIPARKRNSHKGDHGRVLVVGGSVGMCGAPYFAAEAAYRCGAGIVEIFTPEENRQILQTLLPEAIVTAYDTFDFDFKSLCQAIERASAIVVGPGLGTGELARTLVYEVFSKSMSPIIADADALNIVAKYSITYPVDVPVIVTPHPGELSRLTGIDVRDLACNIWDSAMEYALENEVICVSKFSRTVITDGNELYVNTTGGPALAKGGSGDVLCGVIAGMLCCDLSPIDAAVTGVYIHGAAGDIVGERLGDYSSIARDVIAALPEVMKKAGGKQRWQQ